MSIYLSLGLTFWLAGCLFHPPYKSSEKSCSIFSFHLLISHLFLESFYTFLLHHATETTLTRAIKHHISVNYCRMPTYHSSVPYVTSGHHGHLFNFSFLKTTTFPLSVHTSCSSGFLLPSKSHWLLFLSPSFMLMHLFWTLLSAPLWEFTSSHGFNGDDIYF